MTGSSEDRPSAAANIDVTQLALTVEILSTSLAALFATGVGVLALGLIVSDTEAAVAGAAIAGITPALFLLLRRGHGKLAITGAVGLLLMVGLYVLIVGGGIHDVGNIAFPGVVVFGALLLDRRSSILFSTLAVLAIGAVGAAEISGLLTTRYSYAVGWAEVMVQVVVLSGMAWLMQSLARALYASLRDVQVSEQTYREIFNATNESIVIHDADTLDIVDANDTAVAMWGFSHEEFTQLSMADIADHSAGDSEQTVREALGWVVKHGPQTFEWQAKRKDGEPIWVEVSLRAAVIRGQPRIVSAVRDISDRKAVEEQVKASEKLQAVGQLAGGVAHDFNNQLTAILANATLLKERIGASDPAQAQLDAIIQCSNRSADLTRQLLAFARKGPKQDEVVDLDVLVGEVISLLERSIDKRIELQSSSSAAGRARVKGDPSLLQNALLNLGLNARDAMPDGGRLRFETDLVQRGELSEPIQSQLGTSKGPFVRAIVSDTGQGMAPEVVARAFEPFFTTKPRGNGMGLAATYGSIHAHGGIITVRSELGQGTTFQVLIPATVQESVRPGSSPSQFALPELHVLLAEDEELVARVTEESLRSLGCQVTHCKDGRAALDTFQQNPDRFDLVMLDHSMPRMTGSELAQRINDSHPSLPIIATSGFGAAWTDGPHAARCIFLPKPFDLKRLRAALQEAVAP